MRKFILIIFLLFMSAPAFSQSDSTDTEEDARSILEDASEDKDDSYIYDIIEYLTENPIPINSASIKELLQIPFLDLRSATEIIRFRNLSGGIRNTQHLFMITDVDKETLKKISPFIKYEEETKFSFGELLSSKLQFVDFNFRTRGIYDIQEEKAFASNKYPGSRWKIYNRFIVSDQNNFRAGMLIEKDAGENQLNDFTTYNIQIKEVGFIKNLVIGDYIYEFGQGLAMWSRYAYSKGSNAVEVLPRNSRGVVPYLSSDENQFLRGLSSTMKFNNLSVGAFFSSRMLDASIDTTTNRISSIIIDGLHRTETEMRKKDRLKEILFGASATFQFDEIGSLGLLLYSTRYGNEFGNENSNTPSGDAFTYLSTNYSITYDLLTIAGETAISNGKIATLNSAEFLIDKDLAFIFSYRNYSENYWNLHSSGFGERDFAQNENGFYTGIRLRTQFGIINFYYDQYKFFSMNDRYKFPSQGTDFLINYSYAPISNFEIRIRYKNEKNYAIDQFDDIYISHPLRKQNFRAEFTYKISRQIQLRTRGEYIAVTSSSPFSNENGFVIFQDFRITPHKSLQLSARMIFFRTDSYNSRVYEYENDLSGVMTNPGLYGDGLRWYFLVRYNLSFGLSISAKYSELVKPDEKYLGSGDTQINGSLDNRFSLQLDWKF